MHTALFAVAALLALPGPPIRTLKPPAALAPSADPDVKKILAAAPSAKDFPNAQKITLLDLADIVVRPDGTARTVTHQAIKIFTALGREQESEVKIPYDGAVENVKLLLARTIRPDGTVLTVKPTDVRVAQISEYEDAKVISLSMPGVQPGVIIEYQYVTEQTVAQVPGNFWTQWYFQSGPDPVQLTRLNLTLPKSMALQRKLRNSTVEPKVVDTPDGKAVTYTWEQKDVPAFYTEPMMPPMERLLPKLTISTISDWQTIAAWYHKLALDRQIADPTVKAKALELTRDLKTPEEKARAIFYYVQDRTRYVAIELGIAAYQPRPAGATFVNEYGDCKDMTTLLVAMLRTVGVTAHPVLLQAGNPFPLQPEVAAPTAFNHAICLAEIGGQRFWLDATAAVCPWGVVPAADRGCEVLVIRDGRGTFETIPDGTADDAISAIDADLTLRPDGSAYGTVTISGNGDYAMGLRSGLQFTTPDRMSQVMEQIVAPIGTNPKVTGYTLPEYKDRDKPIEIKVNANFPNWATLSGDLLLFKGRADQAVTSAGSPFSDDNRTHPIFQSTVRRQVSRLTLRLPDGYSVLSAPNSVKLSGPLGEYERTVNATGAVLTISQRNEDRRAELPPARYSDVRLYIDSFLKAFNESVIVKKG